MMIAETSVSLSYRKNNTVLWSTGFDASGTVAEDWAAVMKGAEVTKGARGRRPALSKP
jgi:hypothetical protein